MRGKVISIAVLTLLGSLLIFHPALAEVFKWVDDKGTVHFTEEESAIPEKYREQAEKKSTREDSGSPIEKIEKEKPKKKESIKPPPNEPKEKQRVNTRRIESDVFDSFQDILSLWKDRKYDALYDCGDRKSRSSMAREDFGKRMRKNSSELASSWEKVRDIEVEVKSATVAYVTARIGYRPKHGGDTRTRTQTYEMRLENGTWRVNLTKMLQSPK